MELKTAIIRSTQSTHTSLIRYLCHVFSFFLMSDRKRKAGKRSQRKTQKMSKSFVYLRALPGYQLRQDKMKD